ncbi:MAG: hypothetical protein ACJ8C4_20940 [Gemmataceae bacterium]
MRGDRRGVAVIYTMVVMAVIGILLTETARNAIAGRRMLDARQNHLQALWLSRSGVEFAKARLTDDEAYLGETIELIGDSQVIVKVKRTPGDTAVYQVTSEARFPKSGPISSAVTTTRLFRKDANRIPEVIDEVPAEPTPPTQPD